MKTRLLPVVAMIAVAALSLAQAPAERGKAETAINGKTVLIDYGRPALKGRSLSDLTSKLPEDRIWRAGMNQVTTLETATDLVVGEKHIPAGKYSVYVYAPQNGDWALVLNTVLGQPLGKIWAQAPENMAKEPWPHFNYSKEIADKEVARAPMKPAQVNPPVDKFTIDLKPSGDAALLVMSWGDRSWSLPLKGTQ